MTRHTDGTSASEHTRHDRLIVAALVDRSPDSLTADERRRALAQIAGCTECAALHADLIAIAAAVPGAAIPTRPRDFMLTMADAERLRPHGLRRLIGLIGTPRDSFTRPLALGLTTLGIVGLLAASIPGTLGGFGSAGAATSLSAVGAALPEAAGSAAPASAAPAAPAGVPAASAAPSAGGVQSDRSAATALHPTAAAYSAATARPTSADDSQLVYGAANDTPEPATVSKGGTDTAGGGNAAGPTTSHGARDALGGASPLFILAASMLVVGLGLFVLRWGARRTRDA